MFPVHDSRKGLIFVACPCGNPLWSSSITSLKTPSTSHRSWTLSFNFLPVGHWVHSTHYYCSWSVLTYALDPISTGSGSLFWSCRSPEWSLHTDTGAGSIFTSLNDLPVSIFQFASFPCNFSDASGFRIPECCEMLWQIVGSILLLLTSQLIIICLSCWYLYIIVRLTHTGLRWTHPVPHNLGSFNKGISF